MASTHRRLFASLATHLIAEGKKDKAEKVLAKAEKVLPTYNLAMTYENGGTDLIRAYYALGNKAKAEKIVNDMWKRSSQYMNWYLTLSPSRFAFSQRDCLYHLYVMQNLAEIVAPYNQPLAQKLSQSLSQCMKVYQDRGGRMD